MTERSSRLPDPSREAVRVWLNHISMAYLYDQGWKEVNQKTHEVIMGGRQLANENYTDDPDVKAGFMAGMTYAALALVHFSELEVLSAQLFQTTTETDPPAQPIASNGPARSSSATGGGDDVNQPHAA